SQALSEAILNAKTRISLCRQCFTFTDSELCRICANPERSESVLCVVERPADMTIIDQASRFSGKYHVLHGVLSPLDGVGPEDLKIRELLNRLREHDVEEVILATNPSVEGEATSLYLSKLIRPLGIKVTRLAHGIPVGGMLEYTDRQTIHKAL